MLPGRVRDAANSKGQGTVRRESYACMHMHCTVSLGDRLCCLAVSADPGQAADVTADQPAAAAACPHKHALQCPSCVHHTAQQHAVAALRCSVARPCCSHLTASRCTARASDSFCPAAPTSDSIAPASMRDRLIRLRTSHCNAVVSGAFAAWRLRGSARRCARPW